MTTKEFSDGFDTLINSYFAINDFGITASPVVFDEYEKSVFLTEAQEEIVKELYTGNLTGESFEHTEELRRSLDSLIRTDYPENIDSTGVDNRSVFYKLKDEVWFILYESVELVEGAYCKNNPVVEVIPTRIDEWHKIKGNPFKRPSKRKVVRIDNGNNISELISDYPLQNYLVRYLVKPTPIILTPLEDSLSIDGLQEVTECKLNTVLHRTILERAVQLASRRLPASK